MKTQAVRPPPGRGHGTGIFATMSRYQHPDSGGGGGRDRYKPQYLRKSSSNDSYCGGGGGVGSSKDSYADRLVSRYNDSEDREALYLPRTQQRQRDADNTSKYDEIDRKIHARRPIIIDDETLPWWKRRRERKKLIVAASALILVLFIVPRRRKMRITFPGMRRAAMIDQEGHHIVQRAQYNEEDRPKVHGMRRHKKKHREKLHLRLPSDTDVGSGNGGSRADADATFKEDADEHRKVQIIPDDPALLSPEQDPDDPDAPPIFGMSHFKDTSEPYHKSDIPIFWHVPKSGGSTIKDVAGSCHRLVSASNIGTRDGHENDEFLQIVRPGGSMFVNINTHSVEGIQHAKDIGFPSSGMAEIIISNFVHEADALGSTTHMLRFFGVFRHPIERAISMFYYIQVATWEATYHPELKDWTIEQYAQSNRAEENWMTRQLANNPIDALTDDDFALAKEVLRRKFFVGLIDQMEESMDRFERFFRWAYRVNPHNQEKCREGLLIGGGANRNVNATKKAHPKEGTEGWALLAEKNKYDLQLYDYVVELFDQQADLLDVSHPKGFRRIKETCCKCYPPSYPPGGYECPK